MKEKMQVEIKHMIKLNELRNAEIAFVPWKKEFPPANAMRLPRGGGVGARGGHKPQKIFEMQSNMKGLKTLPKRAFESQNLEKWKSTEVLV